MQKRNQLLLSALLLIFFSCSAWMVADYNETVAAGASGLQKKVEKFLVDLERTAGTPEGVYDRHATFYDDVRSEIATLRMVASVQRGNEPTVQSLDLIDENFEQVESMHATGITAREVRLMADFIDTQFRMLVELENAKKRKES